MRHPGCIGELLPAHGGRIDQSVERDGHSRKQLCPVRLRHPGPPKRIADDAGNQRGGGPSGGDLGHSGGITLAQWQKVLHTPGVSVAAPIAVLGYALPESAFPIDLTGYMGNAQRAVFRVDVERITDNGLTRQADAPVYVYITRNAMAPEPTEGNRLVDIAAEEVLGPSDDQPVCAEVMNSTGPFDPTDRGGIGALGNVDCWSLQNGLQLPGEASFAPFLGATPGRWFPHTYRLSSPPSIRSRRRSSTVSTLP